MLFIMEFHSGIDLAGVVDSYFQGKGEGEGGGQWFPFNDSNSRTSMLLDQGIESFLFHTCA